jgi:DNA-binding Lrp family transcriptional regulator
MSPSQHREVHGPAELPPVDREIIRQLQEDGRRPYRQIAAAVGVDEKTVRLRTAELRSSGTIDITTVTDPALLGYGAIAMCGLKVEPSASPSAVAAKLAKVAGVDYVVLAAGRFDVLVEVAAVGLEELWEVVESRVRGVVGVRDLELLPYLRLYYQQLQWGAPGRQGDAKPEAGGRPPLDPVDRRIVDALSEDGRASYRQIAGRLEISESQVRQRVARLKESGTVRIMAVANPFYLGFRRIAWFAVRVDAGVAAEAVAERLAGLPSISYLAVCAGRFDILAEAVCLDDDHLLRLLDEEVRTLAGIRRVEPWLLFKARYKQLRPRG